MVAEAVQADLLLIDERDGRHVARSPFKPPSGGHDVDVLMVLIGVGVMGGIAFMHHRRRLQAAQAGQAW